MKKKNKNIFIYDSNNKYILKKINMKKKKKKKHKNKIIIINK